jgi:hypothetical protein
LGGQYDRRPCDVEGIIQRQTAGFLIHDADNIVVRNSHVIWGVHRPDYYGSALEAHDVTGLVTENFKGTAAHPEREAAIQVIPLEALNLRGER